MPKVHTDSIWRLSWANPEFGQIIASCSEDGTVCIFEEHESSKWRHKATIKVGSKKVAVNDVKFGPLSFGLKIATASADGYLRVFVARDVFDLTQWDLLVVISISFIR